MGQPRSDRQGDADEDRRGVEAYARRSAPPSLMRPFRMAWLARGEVIVSMPRRTSKTSLTMFVPACRQTAPISVSTKSPTSKTPPTQANAPAARTGMVEAVNEKGRRISHVAPSRRRTRDRCRARDRRPGWSRPPPPWHGRPLRGRPCPTLAVDPGRGQQLVDLRLLLDDRLEERQLNPASSWKRAAPAATSSRVPQSMKASSSSSGMSLPASWNSSARQAAAIRSRSSRSNPARRRETSPSTDIM